MKFSTWIYWITDDNDDRNLFSTNWFKLIFLLNCKLIN